uniref:Uncharacterized protein n=1 Tax=Aegilops tauschii subsp. strangulata TaxID=200361 RepID=A0A453E1W4_AEGTS
MAHFSDLENYFEVELATWLLEVAIEVHLRTILED